MYNFQFGFSDFNVGMGILRYFTENYEKSIFCITLRYVIGYEIKICNVLSVHETVVNCNDWL